MRSLVILVTYPLLLAALADPSGGMPYEEDNCRRTVSALIVDECSVGKRSIMLHELGLALSRHRTGKYSRAEDIKAKDELGDLLGVPADWTDEELEELRRQYRQNLEHLLVDCCINRINCSRDLFKGTCT